MARIINFEGRRITVPDDASDEEVAGIIAPQELKPSAESLTNAHNGLVANLTGALTEPVMNMASGMVAKPVSDIAGLAARAYETINPQGGDPEAFRNHVRDQLTYEPKTTAGKLTTEYNPLALIGKGYSALTHGAGDIVRGDQSSVARGAVGNALEELLNQAPMVALSSPTARSGIAESVTPVVSKTGQIAIAPFKAVGSGAASVGRGVVNIADRVLPGGSERGMTRLVGDAAGPDVSALISELQAAKPGETAGQAAVGVRNREFSALDQAARSVAPTPHGRLMDAQKTADIEFLNKQAGALNKETQMGVQGLYKEAETAPIVDRGQVELNAANIAGRLYPKLQGRSDALSAQASSNVGDVRRFVAAGDRATELANNTSPVPGYPRIPGRYTHMGELAKRADDVANGAADASLKSGEGARFAQMQADSLSAYGLKPLDVSAITGKIDSYLNKPGVRADSDAVTVLGGIKDRIQKAVADGGGIPDVHDLYEIRKSGINQVIEQKLKPTDPKYSAKVSATLAAKLKPLIDDAIESAGGNGFKQYLTDYSTAMDRVNQMKLHGKLADAYQNAPATFEKIVMGNDPKAVGKIMGSTGPMTLAEAVPETAAQLRAMGERMQRDSQLGKDASEGMPALSKMVSSEVTSGGRINGMLSRPISIANTVLDVLHGRSNEKTLQRTAEVMRDPAQARKVLSGLLSRRGESVPVSPYQIMNRFQNGRLNQAQAIQNLQQIATQKGISPAVKKQIENMMRQIPMTSKSPPPVKNSLRYLVNPTFNGNALEKIAQ